MKKLLILAVLLFSLTISAQEKQIIKYYSQAQITENEVDLGWISTNARIFFNYSGDNEKVKIYLADAVSTFTITKMEEGVTDGGFKYLVLYLLSAENEEIGLQLFEDKEYGVRLVFKNGVLIQLVE